MIRQPTWQPIWQSKTCSLSNAVICNTCNHHMLTVLQHENILLNTRGKWLNLFISGAYSYSRSSFYSYYSNLIAFLYSYPWDSLSMIVLSKQVLGDRYGWIVYAHGEQQKSSWHCGSGLPWCHHRLCLWANGKGKLPHWPSLLVFLTGHCLVSKSTGV